MDRGLIKVIQKDDTDGKEMKNWRPITLLSQIYKLISGVIAGRMKDPLTELMITDQTTQHNEEHGGDLNIPPLHCLRMT